MDQNNVLVELLLQKKTDLFNTFVSRILTNHRFQVVDRIDIQDEVVVLEIS
jgi:hypothetical protein